MVKKPFKDKNELRKILSGAVRVDSQVIEVSRITSFCNSAAPAKRDSLIFYLFLSTGGWIALIGFLWSLQISKISELTYYYGPLSLFAGMMGVTAGIIFRRKCVRLLKQSLEAPFRELCALDRYLENYIKSVRRRTQTHFNSVNQDTLTNIILIDNVKKAIHERINKLRPYVSSNSYSSLIKADAALRRSIRFCECSELQSNIFYDVPMPDLRDRVEALIANMDLGVSGVENLSQIDFKSSFAQTVTGI